VSFFDDAIQPATIAAIRARIIGFAQSAELKITSWIQGGTGQQMLEASALAAFAFSGIVSKAIRGFASLDTSVDPGDVDPYDPTNVDLPASSGFLSTHGENTHGTVRGGATFASGPVLFVNDGIVSRTFAPGALVFTWTENSPPDPAPTYRNAADDSIYTNPDGTVTVSAGTSLSIPVEADEVGARSSAPPSSLSLTTTLLGCTATNTAAVLGADREDRALYIARCRQAAARLSLGGPSAAYAYLAAKNLDGTPLENASGNQVNITRVYVSQDSDTGIVDAYYASATGAALAEDVTAANENIELEAFAVPDAITFTGAAATEEVIHVSGTVKVKNRPGLDSEAVIIEAILEALGTYFSALEIGGVDQTDGAGFVLRPDIAGVVQAAYLGLYSVAIVDPPSAVSIGVGFVPVLSSVAGDWDVEVVP